MSDLMPPLMLVIKKVLGGIRKRIENFLKRLIISVRTAIISKREFLGSLFLKLEVSNHTYDYLNAESIPLLLLF